MRQTDTYTIDLQQQSPQDGGLIQMHLRLELLMHTHKQILRILNDITPI